MSGALRALAGLRVLDMTRLLPGPFCSRVLVDLGATVDKLEDTGAGDYLRSIPPSAVIDGEQRGAAFELLNVGKRSVAIDLKDQEGRALFLELVTTYDVILESFRPGVLERLGCAPQALLERHPGLVVVSLTGFGSTGPDAHRAGHDLGYLARSGILGISGPSGDLPAMPGVQMADVGAGLWAVIGVLAALRERDRSGLGQHVDVSLFEAASPFGIYTLAEALMGLPSGAPRGDGPLTGGVAVYGTYATRDGRSLAFAALEPKFLGPFFEDHGLVPELHVLAPGAHQAQMRAELTRIFASKSASEWRAYAAERDVCLEVVATPEEWRDDPQRLALAGDRDATKMPLPLGAPPSTRAPRQGEHTSVILAEAGVLGDRADALRARGVVR